MSESPRLVSPNTAGYGPLRCVTAVVVAIISVVPVARPGTSKADGQEYSVVARADAKSAGLTSNEIIVRIGDLSVPATAVKTSPDVPRNIAIVIDAGPDQAKVLSKEKELAVALINELSDASTSFTVAGAGISLKTHATTLDRSVAVEHIRDIAAENGEKKNVPIYDAIGSAIRQVSLAPGLRVVIFIGEGNDGGSKMQYAGLRSLAESNQIAAFAALVADHSLRGTKSILRYGWNLRELANDTPGEFLENEKTPKATRQLSEGVRGLRLVTFEMPPRQMGRYQVSVSARRGKRLHAQKAIVVP